MEKLPLGLALDLREVVPYETGSWRTLMPINIMQTPPCNHGCPAGNDIRGFLRTLAEKKDYEEAWHVLTCTNPLPATCGRVCPHPCEDGCNRRDFDSPVAINSAERAVGDYGLEENLEHKKLIAARKEKVAVIGSGPAGLSCAFHLAKRGFQVKIFEAYGEPGGMMRYGIPSYRLPNYVLRQELENIWKLGIELECNIKVGVNIPMDQLIQTHDAVFLGIGAQTGLTIDIPGQDARNVFSGVEFLREVNSGKYVDVGKDVVVIGGGNTAMDCARVAKRLGANVSVVYRRTRVEMPAITAEIDEAMEERVMFRYHTNPVKILSSPIALPITRNTPPTLLIALFTLLKFDGGNVKTSSYSSPAESTRSSRFSLKISANLITSFPAGKSSIRNPTSLTFINSLRLMSNPSEESMHDETE